MILILNFDKLSSEVETNDSLTNEQASSNLRKYKVAMIKWDIQGGER